jgi:glycosyltransferase involved in cell wall biosynthesis
MLLASGDAVPQGHPVMVDSLAQETRLERPGYLFVLPWSLAGIGGVNQVVYRLYQRAASGREIRPWLLVTCWEKLKDGGYVTGVRQMHLRLRSPWEEGWRVKEIAGFLLALPSSLWILARFLRAERVRVVNPHFPDLACLHFALLRRLGLFCGSLVFSLHGAEINQAASSRGIERFLWRFLLRSADAITACSRWLASVAVNFDPSLAQRVRVVYNAADEADRNDGSSGAGEPPLSTETERIVLNIGKFEHKKGQDVLLAAFKRLLGDRPDIHLVLVGGAGPALDEVQGAIIAEGLEDRVRLNVNVPHHLIWRFLAEASVFVLSSRIEPFGIVVLEAGLSEVPVVASNVGGVPEIVTDGVNGRLVPPDDPVALANAMAEFLDHPAEAARMAKQLRHNILTRFSWEQCYQGYLDAAGVGRARA